LLSFKPRVFFINLTEFFTVPLAAGEYYIVAISVAEPTKSARVLALSLKDVSWNFRVNF